MIRRKPETLEQIQKVSRLALSLVDPREFHLRDFDHLSDVERFFFWDLVERNSLRVNASHAFKKANREHDVPSPIARAAKRELEREANRELHAAALVQALTIAKIDCIVLKGSVIGHELLSFPGYKRMNDFDFLVKKSDALKTVQVIESLGYQSSRAIFGKSADVDFKKHHSPPFYLPDGACVLGLHWDLLSPHRSERSPLERVWANKSVFRYGDVDAFRLGWDDFLIHLAAHLSDAKIGARELGDVFLVLQKALPAINVDDLMARIREWNAIEKFRNSLGYVLAAFPVLKQRQDIQSLISALESESSEAISAKSQARIAYGEAIIWLRTLVLSRIEKCYALSRLCPDPADRFHFWKASYITAWRAKDEDIGAVRAQIYLGKGKPSTFSRWIFPWKCIRALGKDHGALLIALVTLINAIQAISIGLRLKIGWLKPTGEKLAVQGALMELE